MGGMSNKLRLLKNKRKKPKGQQQLANNGNYSNSMQIGQPPMVVNNSMAQQSRVSTHFNTQQEDDEIVDIFVIQSQRKILQLEKELESASLSAPKKYALNKQLKLEK